MSRRDDAIRDLIDRLIEAAGREGTFSESLAVEIERQWRCDYRGERIYVAAVAEPVKARAVEMYVASAPIDEIRRETGISRSALYRLIKR